MSRDIYQARLELEEAIYKDCLDVHSLPPIFHYWSDRYVRPRFEEFGFSNPNAGFSKYLGRECARRAGGFSQFVSIGSGNCDVEIGVVRDLRNQGFKEFSIECLDLNPAMLERGAEAARAAGAAEYLIFTPCDFNEWQPGHEYDGVIANQSLHHVVQLEQLFTRVRNCLSADGCFVISDMIGRNGHQRWPEALDLVQKFWRKLPPSYRFNHSVNRYEDMFQDRDCSLEGFEGIRSQDVLPLLRDSFHFELFVAFANVIDPFIDRVFGINFDTAGAWDRAFIDTVHACDEAALRSGRVKPTHMFAVVGKSASSGTKYTANLSPDFCVRDPGYACASFVPSAAEPRPYQWDSLPNGAQRELEFVCEHLRAKTERVEELLAWGGKLDIECVSLQRDCDERTAWAQGLDKELIEVAARAARLEAESDRRAEWALGLESELRARTAWALSLEEEMGKTIAERTAWALRLDRELEERTAWALSLDGQLQEIRDSPWKGLRCIAVAAARRWKQRIIGVGRG